MGFLKWIVVLFIIFFLIVGLFSLFEQGIPQLWYLKILSGILLIILATLIFLVIDAIGIWGSDNISSDFYESIMKFSMLTFVLVVIGFILISWGLIQIFELSSPFKKIVGSIILFIICWVVKDKIDHIFPSGKIESIIKLLNILTTLLFFSSLIILIWGIIDALL